MTKTCNVYITRSAEQDILDIWDYISDDSKSRARKFVAQLESEIAKLKKYPQRCSVINESELFGKDFFKYLYSLVFEISLEIRYSCLEFI